MNTQLTTIARPIYSRRRLALSIAGFGLLALAAGWALAPSAASAPAPAVAPSGEIAAVGLSAPADLDNTRIGRGCWVTGDMVWSPEGGAGGNPAEMVQALCGGR
jgi:hypothetical protein